MRKFYLLLCSLLPFCLTATAQTDERSFYDAAITLMGGNSRLQTGGCEEYHGIVVECERQDYGFAHG